MLTYIEIFLFILSRYSFLEIWKTAHLRKTTIMDIYGNVMNKFPI